MMFPKINYSYQSNDYYVAREVICTNLTEAVSTIITLPSEIQIRFASLGQSVYGSTALEYRFRNRVSLNNTLTVSELPEVLVHELIHLHQSHTGVLRTTRDGKHFWNDKYYTVTELVYEEYLKLPWEEDVEKRHKKILNDALLYAIKRMT